MEPATKDADAAAEWTGPEDTTELKEATKEKEES